MTIYQHYFRNVFVLSLILIGLVSWMPWSNAIAAEKTTAKEDTMSAKATCEPTPRDYLGPFYKENSPVRNSVGKGYELRGMVKSAQDCALIAGARIELWLAGPDGHYDDDHRATMFSNESGQYRFESNIPPGYAGRPPHIHLRISADGFQTLATQHYPGKGRNEGYFDLVLEPEN